MYYHISISKADLYDAISVISKSVGDVLLKPVPNDFDIDLSTKISPYQAYYDVFDTYLVIVIDGYPAYSVYFPDVY